MRGVWKLSTIKKILKMSVGIDVCESCHILSTGQVYSDFSGVIH